MTVRVDLDKVDRLVNLLGELVVNQSMLAQSVNEAGLGDSEVSVGLDAFTILTRNLQDTVMSIRAQPVKPLFQRMARIVREASSSVGKEVRLITEGDATEVDKTLIERLAEPLTHMIRNAVDHGLEDTERRLTSGKTREGNITLSATHRAGRVLIEVSDDGPGINDAKVREIAVQKNLISADAALTKSEIYELIMQPGFSTASSVSALSGRGVGMDVVRSSIEEMGGRLSIESAPGKGSTFSISLPLTLAVLEGMIIRSAEHTFVMPLTSILETIAHDDSKIVRTTGSLPLLHIRGALVPLFNLSDRLGLPSGRTVGQDGVVLLTVQEDGSSEYDLAIYVANWPSPRRYAWSTLLRARAIENLAYVVGVNRVGTDGNGFHYSGDSAMLDPLGMPLVELGAQAQVITSTLSADHLRSHRERFPAYHDADRFVLEG